MFIDVPAVVPAEATRPRPRVDGIDLARGLAVLGMVLVNIRLVTAPYADHPRWLRILVGLVDGRSAATFVTLAGIGAGLAAQAARSRPGGQRRARRRLARRALFLFATGLLLLSPLIGWTADILHFYGIYLLVGAAVLFAPDAVILLIAGVSAVAAALMTASGTYFAHWDIVTLDYHGLGTPVGFLRNLFLDGFHPVAGWLAFYLFGLWLGRKDLRDRQLRRRLTLVAVPLVLGAELVSWLLVGPKWVSIPDLAPSSWRWLFSAEPVPPSPVYLVAGGGTAVLVIVASLALTERLPRAVTEPVRSTGRLAFTLYVGHVVVGMGILEAMGRLSGQTLWFAVLAALTIDGCAVLLSWLLLRRVRYGPLEWLMRRVAG